MLGEVWRLLALVDLTDIYMTVFVPASAAGYLKVNDDARGRRPRMSVVVAAERFDWRAGEATLENAFISLLPEEKRTGHKTIVVAPRTS